LNPQSVDRLYIPLAHPEGTRQELNELCHWNVTCFTHFWHSSSRLFQAECAAAASHLATDDIRAPGS